LACEDYVYHLEPLEEMLGYKIPVVWPGNDWYVADKAKPFAAERRSRLRKSGRRRSQDRTRKGTEARPSSNRTKPRTAPGALNKTKPGTVPGAFFGFGPGDPQRVESTTTRAAVGPDSTAKGAKKRGREVPPSKIPASAQGSAPKKKRPPRRKKKAPPRAADASAPDTKTDRA
jgi:ATP-dependent RNA helicase RhlB